MIDIKTAAREFLADLGAQIKASPEVFVVGVAIGIPLGVFLLTMLTE